MRCLRSRLGWRWRREARRWMCGAQYCEKGAARAAGTCGAAARDIVERRTAS